jgi:hypothetical protein
MSDFWAAIRNPKSATSPRAMLVLKGVHHEIATAH